MIQPQKSHKNRAVFIFVLMTLVVIAGSFLGLKIYKAVLAEKSTAQSANLTILTAHSFPMVGGDWLVQFTTRGQEDLRVEGTDGTFFEPTDGNEQGDLRFLTLKCGNTEFAPVRQGNSYVYPNWNCKTSGFFSDLALTQGRHYLKFTFGDQIAYAYNTAGILPWTKRLGGTSSDSVYDIATDANDNVIVAGRVTGTTDLNADLNGDGDTSDANETPAAIHGNGEAIISVFNSSGTFQWSKRLGGAGADLAETVTTDTDNNVIAFGIVNGSADLNGDGDTSDANETPSGTYGGRDIFISKFNSSGTFQWSKRLGGTGLDHGYGIASDTNNRVIVTGRVTGTADLNGDGDTTDANEVPSGTYGGIDAFISVFDSSGTFQWSKRLGGTGDDYGYYLTTDTNDNVIVIGTVPGTADLNGDDDTLDANETPSATYDAFISVFNSSGTFQWSKRLGGTGVDFGDSLTTDTNNNVIIDGSVVGTADLNGDGDTTDLNETPSGTYGNSTDAFISVFNSSGTFQWSKRLGGTDTDYGNDIITDADDNVILIGGVTGTADLNGDDDTLDANETPSGTYGGQDAFISVFNSSGTFQWSKRLGGMATDYGNGIVADTDNNIIIDGSVYGTADLNGDGDTTDANEIPSAIYGLGDIYISKFIVFPSVSAGVASNISLTSATLNGSIDSMGMATVTARGFNWGTDTSYGATVSTSGSYDAGSFSANLSSLVCGTSYHFRSFATNAQGTGRSSDHSFGSSPCPGNAAPGSIGGGGGVFVPLKPPRYAIYYPDGTIVYLDTKTTPAQPPTSASTPPPPASSSVPPSIPTTTSPPPQNPSPALPPSNTTPVYTSPASSLVTFVRGLWFGLQNPDVLKLQTVLNKDIDTRLADMGSGSPGNETDYFGSRTLQAVKNFQLKYNISDQSDPNFGYVGPKTRAKLNEGVIADTDSGEPVPAVPSPTIPTSAPAVLPQTAFTHGLWLGLQDPDVLRLQVFLNQDSDTHVADTGVGSLGNETDYFDSGTLQAVKNFQLKYNISDQSDPNFGYVGPNTRAKLNEMLAANGS